LFEGISGIVYSGVESGSREEIRNGKRGFLPKPGFGERKMRENGGRASENSVD
jgi:hypothetical protein